MQIAGVEVDNELGLAYRHGRANDVLEKLSASESTGSFLRGLCLAALGRRAEAAVEFTRCLPDVREPARVQLAYLNVLAHQKLDESLDELSHAQQHAGENDSLLGAIWHCRGLAEGKRRRTAQAAAALMESLTHFRRCDDIWSVAQVRDTLGTVEAARGRLDYALQWYALALVDKSLLNDRLGMAITLGNLGRVHLRAGRYADAVECFERDREICHELRDQRGLCRMHNDLGRAWIAAGDWERAEEELNWGITLATDQGYSDIAFYCHKDLAILRIEQRRLDEAERALEQARSFLGPGSAAYLTTVWNAVHGELLTERNDPQAVAVLEDAVRSFAASELPDWEIPARVALARAFIENKQPLAAERCLLVGLRLARQNGYARYFPILNETMMRLDLAEGAELEQGRKLSQPAEKVAETATERTNVALDYLIREELGSGGFGTVYRAYDAQRGTEVALKSIPMSQYYDVETRSGLLHSTKTELSAASRVKHPGIARVYAIGEEPSGDLYICQELILGRSLRQAMQEVVTPQLHDTIPVFLEITFALEALHAARVFHRDLKPENILLRDGLHPVLIDFGVAQLKPPGWFERSDVAGTLEYMAPEQSAGKSVDARADLYSLGVIMYEWLAGRRPWRIEGTTWTKKVAELQSEPARPITIRRPDLPPAAIRLIHQLLEKKWRRRPPTARHVAELLQTL